jgi:hypothetical protein
MRRPYDFILVLAIIATIIFFVVFDTPINPNKQEEIHDISTFGLGYVVLIFGIIACARLYFKKRP